MKRPILTSKHKTFLTRVMCGFILLPVTFFSLQAPPRAYGAPQNVIHTYKDETPAYDPDACAPGSSDGGAATATGPAADLLKKQTKLDGRWVDVIVKYAGQSGADPLAMASLLFWENRSFPAYKSSGWPVSGSVGSGPWQITAGTWPSSAGDYVKNSQDPDVSTKVAANIVKSYGGTAGISLGTIKQNFSKNVVLKTMATLAKNYNAGQGTYRDPGVADWRQSGRIWYAGSSPWGGSKPQIIDDYVVGMTYVYYQIATGTPVSWKGDDSYLQEAQSKQSSMQNFKWSPNGSSTTTTTGATADATGSKPTIVLDPGHAPATDIQVDPGSNIAVFDSNNQPERDQTWAVAQKVKTDLTSAGYNVLITKKSSDDGTTDLKKRADFAAQNNAALGISIHTSPGGGNANAVFAPKVGEYRMTTDGKTKKYYNNQALADKDLDYAKKMAKARSDALGADVKAGSYGDIFGVRDTSRNGIVSKGTVLITDYFATTPWVYNEQAQDTTGSINDSTISKYAEGIVNGVKAIVPASGTSGDTGSTCDSTGANVGNAAVQGDIVKTALNYAWPNHGKHPGVDKSAAKPSYQTDMPKYDGATDFNPYSDCGVFVATVMIASGVDKNYTKRGTGNQEQYVRSHPELYTKINATSTSGLQPGDIFIVNGGGQGHTYIYTGNYKGDDGKTYNAAAASLNQHVPEADMTYFSQGGVAFTIWRHK